VRQVQAVAEQREVAAASPQRRRHRAAAQPRGSILADTQLSRPGRLAAEAREERVEPSFADPPRRPFFADSRQSGAQPNPLAVTSR
jgi:hypothetical protein